MACRDTIGRCSAKASRRLASARLTRASEGIACVVGQFGRFPIGTLVAGGTNTVRSLPFLRGSYLAIATIASGCFEGNSCFVRGTRVATADGARLIESLVVGDVVLSYSHREKAIVTRRVVAIHRSTVREVRTVEVIAEGRTERLRVTPSHPFWVDSRGDYVAVRDLRENDVLLLRSGSGVRSAIVRSITAEESSVPSVEVFNISVETPESNYFAEGVLVHNKEEVPPSATARRLSRALPRRSLTRVPRPPGTASR